jgi:hypothetical protein
MSFSNILLSEIYILPEAFDKVKNSWSDLLKNDKNSVLYSLDEENKTALLIVSKINDGIDLNNLILEIEEKLQKEWSEYIVSDWRRQVLKLQESVKPLDYDLPNSKFLQLRHIEVPLRVHNEYLKWREKTIFAHVKQQDEIEFFLAYHSVLSSEPGVMFLSGFSCPEKYKTIFSQEKYQNIIKEAGEKYIFGGEKGLYTRIYQKI